MIACITDHPLVLSAGRVRSTSWYLPVAPMGQCLGAAVLGVVPERASRFATPLPTALGERLRLINRFEAEVALSAKPYQDAEKGCA